MKLLGFKRYLLVALAGSVCAFAVTLSIVGQARAVSMSPIRLEMAADPGASTSGIVKIYNDERVHRTLYLSVAKFETKDETGQPMFVAGKDQLVAWISIPPTITLSPNESKEVPFTITVPEATDPGGYFAAIFASVVPIDPSAGGQVALRSDVGTLLLFRVNGDFKEGETILEFSTKDKQKLFTNLPIEFYYRFQNDGDDRALPLGDITIRNFFGGLSKIISANHGVGNTLPQSIRRYQAAWVTAGGDDVEHNYGPVVYPEFKNFWQAVQFQTKNFALGYYSAELKLTVNNDVSRSYIKHALFWVIPWQLLTVVLAVLVLFVTPLLVLLYIISVYLRRRRKDVRS